MTNLKRNRANDRNVRTAHLHLGSGVLVSCYRSRNPNGDSERCDVRAVATARQRGLQLHCTSQGVVHSVQARLQRPPIRLVPHIPALLTALENLQHLTGGELRLLQNPRLTPYLRYCWLDYFYCFSFLTFGSSDAMEL